MGTSLDSDAPPSTSPPMEYQRQPESNIHTLGMTESDSWDEFEENEPEEVVSEDDYDDQDDALFTESGSESHSHYSQSVLPAVSQESSNINNSSEEEDMCMDEVSTIRSQVSAAGSTLTSASGGGPTAEDQAELRRTVQALFELEESLLNQHMSNIQENAEMLTKE
jgi:hypothetical protein